MEALDVFDVNTNNDFGVRTHPHPSARVGGGQPLPEPGRLCTRTRQGLYLKTLDQVNCLACNSNPHSRIQARELRAVMQALCDINVRALEGRRMIEVSTLNPHIRYVVPHQRQSLGGPEDDRSRYPSNSKPQDLNSTIGLLQAACGDEKRNITFEEFKNIIRWRRADEEGGDEEERLLGA